eukprot:CAMPEP_0179347956 /NCGR_PEP_ID=MMETSP0797-20121207/73441_1 /TAXON_ID=47934 /ORGANISM="Dinophysis acuminata, Strain DAEP01" /LENGTH=61 /DNA_ID=CAMNT_0021062721 /DNA_START=136 /DNA_END=318 /DNA_ORIENTATION=+
MGIVSGVLAIYAWRPLGTLITPHSPLPLPRGSQPYSTVAVTPLRVKGENGGGSYNADHDVI